MSLGLILVWISAISSLAVGAAYFARRDGRPDALIALYVTLVIASNVVASKIVAYDLSVATLFAPGATPLFAATFLITDIVNERFGKRETIRMIALAFFAQLVFLLFSFMALTATPAPFFQNQAAFEAVFSAVPRIAIAGLVTFFICEVLDAYLYQWLRAKTRGRHLWLRNALSSLPAMLLDSAIFVTLAFYGTTPIFPLIVGLTAVKWLVGIVDIPFMYAARYAIGVPRN